MLSFFLLDVLDAIGDVIESLSERFLIYSWNGTSFIYLVAVVADEGSKPVCVSGIAKLLQSNKAEASIKR